MHAETDGALDITSGPLSEAWGFSRREGRIPLLMPGLAIGDGKLSVGRLRMRAAPALVTVEGFGLSGTRLGLAGDGMRLFMP